MPGMRNGMAKKKAKPVKKMRGGGMSAKPKPPGMKEGGGARRSGKVPRKNPLPENVAGPAPQTKRRMAFKDGGEAMMDPPPKAKALPKKMRGGGMAMKDKPPGMRNGGAPKKKAKPIKRANGGAVVRSSSKKPL